MGAIDQLARNRFLALQRVASGDDQAAVFAAFDEYISGLDGTHTARLKALLANRSWFRLSEVGPQAATAAFQIVQHSGDLPLMRQVLESMDALRAENEVVPGDYALLHDRLALREGRMQRYGTQASTCTGEGRYAVPSNVKDPAGLDTRRAELGLQPMSDYLSGLDRLYGRCRASR